ncbi:MAG: ThiF family adenylyltransferase [Phycisphaerales bacterium]|nr:ThiF family adenylyltransferase [Phycisphaerales bacterium]
MSRYHRQMLLDDIGPEGQQAIGQARVLIVGLGALGCGVADWLARAGVGHLRIADRDIVEHTNLQRQVLYCHADAQDSRPKAIAAARRLTEVNPDIEVDPHVTDVTAATVESLAAGCDLIIDGLDNLDTRYLINDLCVREGLPWIYGGAVGTGGLVMPLLGPHCGGRIRWDTPTGCLRCVFPDPPPPGTLPTCDTAGVLGPAVGAVTSHQAALAMSILVGRTGDALDRTMHAIDPWSGESRRMALPGPRDACPCCSGGTFDWLEGGRGDHATVLCGRGAVQVHPPTPGTIDLALLADRLQSHGQIQHDEHVLRCTLPDDISLTVFADGRALISTDDTAVARTLYDRYIG